MDVTEHLAPEHVFKVADYYINNTMVNFWIIIVVVGVLSFLLTRRLSVDHPSKRQVVLEMLVGLIRKFLNGTLDKKGRAFVPYLASVLIFLGVANTIGFFGLTPPTKDINLTATLALMSIVLVQIAGIKARGVKGWLHSFLEPVAIVTPINILELGIKPLSLCMRLFGNVLGAFIVMELLKSVCALIVPVPFSLYFDLFDGLIQAYVFVFLTSMYINEAVETPA